MEKTFSLPVSSSGPGGLSGVREPALGYACLHCRLFYQKCNPAHAIFLWKIGQWIPFAFEMALCIPWVAYKALQDLALGSPPQPYPSPHPHCFEKCQPYPTVSCARCQALLYLQDFAMLFPLPRMPFSLLVRLANTCLIFKTHLRTPLL